MKLHAQIIEESGKPEFAGLPIGNYESLLNELLDFESIEDLADYLRAIKIKSENKSWHSLDEVKEELRI